MSRRKIPGLLVDVVVVAVLLGLTCAVGMLLLACGRAAEPLGSQASPPAGAAPDPGLVLPCKVIDVHDGDADDRGHADGECAIARVLGRGAEGPGGTRGRDRAAAARAGKRGYVEVPLDNGGNSAI